MRGDRPSMAAMVTMIVAMPILGSLVGGALYASELGHRSLALWLFACFALGFVAAMRNGGNEGDEAKAHA